MLLNRSSYQSKSMNSTTRTLVLRQVCKNCDRKYNNKRDLRRHVKQLHSLTSVIPEAPKGSEETKEVEENNNTNKKKKKKRAQPSLRYPFIHLVKRWKTIE